MHEPINTRVARAIGFSVVGLPKKEEYKAAGAKRLTLKGVDH